MHKKVPEVGQDYESCVHGLHMSTLSQQRRLKANGVPDTKHKHPGAEVGGAPSNQSLKFKARSLGRQRGWKGLETVCSEGALSPSSLGLCLPHPDTP